MHYLIPLWEKWHDSLFTESCRSRQYCIENEAKSSPDSFGFEQRVRSIESQLSPGDFIVQMFRTIYFVLSVCKRYKKTF